MDTLTHIQEVFTHEYAIRAFYASAMVGVMCGVLGCFIVLRNMSLIGDALSHAILPGVVAGFMIAGYSVLGFFTGSVIAGLIAAILITWIQRNVKTQEDAAIGIVFTSMFAIGIMGISWLTRQEGVHLDLKDFLFGNVLGISDQDLWMTLMVMCFTIICVLAFYRFFFITTFESVVAQTIGISVSSMHYFLMLLLSFAVVASLQSVGVILVVAMLITPASTAYLLTHRMDKMIVIAAITGFLSTTIGLLISIVYETTPGPAMTVTATFAYLLAVFFSPKRGLLSRYLKRKRKRRRILQEDVLKQVVRLSEKHILSQENIANRLGLTQSNVQTILRQLVQKQLIQFNRTTIELTEKGQHKGYALIRAHRLWETYLVKEMGLGEDQIHENAEKYEHILTGDLLEALDTKLGHPSLDPHGSPIPLGRHQLPTLSTVKAGEKILISHRQMNHLVRSKLWQMDLHPGTEVIVSEDKNGNLQLTWNGKTGEVEKGLARQIAIEALEG